MPGTGTNRENSRGKLSKLPDVNKQPASSRPCHRAAAYKYSGVLQPGGVGDGDDVSCRSCNILEDIGHALMPVLFSFYRLTNIERFEFQYLQYHR